MGDVEDGGEGALGGHILSLPVYDGTTVHHGL